MKPEDIAEYLGDTFAERPEQEQIWVICLNTRGYPIGKSLVTLGTATASLAHPREIFRVAILASATSIIVSHNHPSGDPTPSSADISITRQIKESGRIIGIELLDHVIIGDKNVDPSGNGFYSFRNAGLV